ncbi:MAG: hypothetical protein ACI4XM_05225 [Candidatus Coprovivens sp.]
MKDTITIKNDLGEEKTFDIVFSFISKDTNKEYITYTDYTKDYKGNIKCYSVMKDGEKLLPVETEKELLFINETLKTITSDLQEKYVTNE